MTWYRQGQDPDYRFSLANERTFLAWIRTALAVLAGGLLVHQFVTRLQPPWAVAALSTVLVGCSGALAIGAYLRWRSNEIAMRHGHALPHSRLVLAMAVMVAALAAAAAALLLRQ